jgi:RHS repeat-associated protein
VDLVLFYNSRVWTVDTVNSTATFNADRDYPSYGFRLGYGQIEGPMADDTGSNGYILTEPDGTQRDLHFLSSTKYESLDSTYIDYNPSTKILSRADGTQWQYQQVGTSTIYRPIQIKDRNGNYIAIAYSTAQNADNSAITTITDTLGRTITFNYDQNNRLLNITVPAYGGTGTTQVAAFGWSQKALNYSFSGLTVADSSTSGTSLNMLTSCTYASGTSYSFVYGDWGIISEIDQKSSNGTLRSSVSYDFPAATTALTDAPTFTHETVFDGVNSGVWTYSVTKVGKLVSAMAITDPPGTVTTTNLYTTGWQTGLVSSTTVQKGSTTYSIVINTWVQDNINLSWKLNPRVTQVTATNDTGQQTTANYSYTTSYGDVSQIVEFGFGALARTTQTDYVTATSYINQHIFNLPSQMRIYDGSSNLISRTDLVYDGASVTGVTGVSHHDDTNYGSGFNVRGNLTRLTSYANAAAATGPVTKNSTFDSLGNVRTAQVNCCQLQQIAFSSITQYAYPDSLTRGASGGTQLVTNWTYDFNTGLLLTERDPNNQQVTYGYDVVKRVTSVTGPLNSSVTSSFDDASSRPGVTTTTALDASNSQVQISITDGLGRVLQKKTQSAGGTVFSIVETQYDSMGRATQVSNPHGPSESPVWATYGPYDALGRPTTVTPSGGMGSYQYAFSGNSTTVTDPGGKQRRTFVDAASRLIEADEPGYDDGSHSSGSVTMFGSDQSMCDPDVQPPKCVLIWDFGTVSITVGNFTASANYSRTTTPAGLASTLGGQFNSNSSSPVTATVNSATINLVSKVAGTQTNYPISIQANSSSPNFGGSSSFGGNPSGATMTGGTDGTGSDGQPPTLNTPLVTVSNYDPINNLVSVFQGVQQRIFQYDSMGRLTQSTTPEAGTVSFQYNSFNLLTQRTDARGVISNYSYDTLNRPSQVSYNVGTTGVPATASVNYTYDEGGAAAYALGRLTHLTDGVGTETYTYDALGRTTNLQKVIAGTSYPIAYQYNNAGELKQMTYPSGRIVAQTFDPIGRLSQLQVNGANYLSSLSYNAAGEALGFTYGNGVQATVNYNSQMQLASLAYAKSGSTLFSLTYNYGTGNNGQIQNITDNVDSTRTTTFTYDPWSRLKTASNTQWSITESYDRYGNRNAQTPPVNFSQAANPVTNRLPSPYAYDAAGNMTNDGSNTLAYDAESRSISSTNGAASGASVYDGNGLRVKRCLPNCTSPTTTTVYVFSRGKMIAEYDNGVAVSSPSREYIYSGAKLLGTISGGATTYHHPDHLSVRVSTDSSGNAVRTFGDFPFGEVWYETGTASKWKFTSYERDSESQNDYAMARFHVNRLARFSSPDPHAGSIADPQSLNRYTYARNNPVSLTDPTGLCIAALLDENGNVKACYDSILWGGTGGSPWGLPPEIAEAEAQYNSQFGIEFKGTLYGKYYDQVFSNWDEYANWATGIAALPESQMYQSFLLIASNQHIDPNALLMVGYQYAAMVYGVWVPDLADESVDSNAAVNDGGWQDPLTGFHKGADSWYFGNLFGFDTGHLVDSIVTDSGEIPINAHIDPFGPFNPFHYIIQLPSMLFGKGDPGTATCAVYGGCSIN